MLQKRQLRRVIPGLIAACSVVCLVAKGDPVTESTDALTGLSLAQADEVMVILKSFCGRLGLNVRYAGPCGTPGSFTRGRVWDLMNSTGQWVVSEAEEDGTENWVRIWIRPRAAAPERTSLFLMDGELSMTTVSVVDRYTIVDPDEFRFNNGQTWPEMLASLSDDSKSESEQRRERAKTDWKAIFKILEETQE